MRTRSPRRRDVAGRKLPGLNILFVLLLVILLFLLVHTMVTHRFHRGGWVNRHGTITP